MNRVLLIILFLLELIGGGDYCVFKLNQIRTFHEVGGQNTNLLKRRWDLNVSILFQTINCLVPVSHSGSQHCYFKDL